MRRRWRCMRLLRSRSAAPLLVASAAVALLAAGPLSSPATARRTTAVITDGTYGALSPRGEYVIFKVRNRRVRKLEFQIRISCETPDTPGSEERFFSAGAEAPQGRLVPANGKLVLEWQERGDGRLGNISAELKFGVHDVANFAVIVPEERGPESGPEEALESCNGVGSLRVRRGFEVPPVP
jgi:hypothetical protein